MEEKIKALYENINFIGYYCMSHRKYDYVEKAKSLFPAISEFVEWFMAGNQFGIASQFCSEYVKGSACLLSLLQIGIVVLIFVHQEGIVDMYDAEAVCGETLAQEYVLVAVALEVFVEGANGHHLFGGQKTGCAEVLVLSLLSMTEVMLALIVRFVPVPEVRGQP